MTLPRPRDVTSQSSTGSAGASPHSRRTTRKQPSPQPEPVRCSQVSSAWSGLKVGSSYADRAYGHTPRSQLTWRAQGQIVSLLILCRNSSTSFAPVVDKPWRSCRGRTASPCAPAAIFFNSATRLRLSAAHALTLRRRDKRVCRSVEPSPAWHMPSPARWTAAKMAARRQIAADNVSATPRRLHWVRLHRVGWSGSQLKRRLGINRRGRIPPRRGPM